MARSDEAKLRENSVVKVSNEGPLLGGEFMQEEDEPGRGSSSGG